MHFQPRGGTSRGVSGRSQSEACWYTGTAQDASYEWTDNEVMLPHNITLEFKVSKTLANAS